MHFTVYDSRIMSLSVNVMHLEAISGVGTAGVGVKHDSLTSVTKPDLVKVG